MDDQCLVRLLTFQLEIENEYPGYWESPGVETLPRYLRHHAARVDAKVWRCLQETFRGETDQGVETFLWQCQERKITVQACYNSLVDYLQVG